MGLLWHLVVAGKTLSKWFTLVTLILCLFYLIKLLSHDNKILCLEDFSDTFRTQSKLSEGTVSVEILSMFNETRMNDANAGFISERLPVLSYVFWSLRSSNWEDVRSHTLLSVVVAASGNQAS